MTGVRAYNVRPDLRANQQRLLDYVQNGGTLIVQYNVAEGGPFGGRRTGELAHIGPYPLEMGRGRVSVEEAPVRFLEPDNPLLVSPNRITEHDFEGWIQERGLYFASEWDPHYQPVLETHDPGEKPLEGGMLYARYGKGVYIFTRVFLVPRATCGRSGSLPDLCQHAERARRPLIAIDLIFQEVVVCRIAAVFYRDFQRFRFLSSVGLAAAPRPS